MSRQGGYTPHGRMIPLLAAMEAEPDRTFTGAEAAQIMDCDVRTVTAYVFYAARAGRVFKRVEGKGNKRKLFLRATPFEAPAVPVHTMRAKPLRDWITTDEDVRVPKVVPGWTPPKMVCTRLGQS